MIGEKAENWSISLRKGDLREILEKINHFIQFWLDRLQNAGSLPSDSADERLRKAVLIFLASTCGILGVIWGLGYLALGLPLSGSIPLIYSAVSGTSLFYFFKFKQYKFFCRSQLVLILVLPFFLQWSLGGFAASGAGVIWSILAPIGALMFAGPTRAIPWFLAYLLIMVVSVFLSRGDSSSTVLPLHLTIISFLFNIGGVSAIVFILLKYFVQAREDAMAALDKEHRRVRQSLSLAMEVQQNLLPKIDPCFEGLDISGKSIYCDETGGDYYDFLLHNDHGQDRLGIVVGDVSDHGIPSALLMATARAFIRQRSSRAGNLAEIINDTNRQLARDVEDSGRFMTLFFAEFEKNKKEIQWINAGHEPATIYDPATDTFNEFAGEGGVPLGVFEDSVYRESKLAVSSGQIILIATDGMWEAQNPEGDMFGKDRIHSIVRKYANANAKHIQEAIFDELNRFRKNKSREDDMTLVVVKVL